MFQDGVHWGSSLGSDQQSARLSSTLPPTFLQHLQVLPQDVSHVRRSTCYESLLAHGTDVLPLHVELMDCSALKRELPDCPTQPVRHVRLIPLPRICKDDDSHYSRDDTLFSASVIQR